MDKNDREYLLSGKRSGNIPTRLKTRVDQQDQTSCLRPMRKNSKFPAAWLVAGFLVGLCSVVGSESGGDLRSRDAPSAQPGCRSSARDVSIIIPARNDAHGGDFMNRLRNSLLLLSRFSWEESEVTAEILVVVWQDPEDAIPVHEALGFGNCKGKTTCAAREKRSSDPGSQNDGGMEDAEDEEYWHDMNVVIRFLIVPPERHAEAHNPLNLGLLQYVAKNVGMRRACGRHVLITNADCLLPWAMLNHIVSVVKQSKQEAITDVDAVRGRPFTLASRHDLLLPMKNVERDEVLQTHMGLTGVSLRELTGDDCSQRGFANVYTETRKFSSLLNIGDFLLIPWDAINVTLGYSEHHHPFGLDGELVCRLALKHRMKPALLSPPCVVLHQPHPHAYNFSHPPFPWQKVCEDYDAGRGRKDERGRADDQELEWGVTREWGFPHWELTEHVLFPSGRMLTDRFEQSLPDMP